MPVKPKNLISTFDSARPSRAFFDWLDKNKAGFFINTFQETSGRYIKLHGAKCGIATSTKRYGPNGATQGAYKKICSKDPDVLIDYLVSREGVPFEKIMPCKKCSARKLKLLPPATAPDEMVLTTNEALEEEGRRKLITHFAFERSSRNRRIVLESRPKPYACEACDLSLGVYGSEYEMLIHVHHKRPVGKGVNSPKKEDFLLLCPNCHVVAHWGRATNPLNLAELRKRAAAVRAKWAE
jgi:hypothetical protein